MKHIFLSILVLLAVRASASLHNSSFGPLSDEKDYSGSVQVNFGGCVWGGMTDDYSFDASIGLSLSSASRKSPAILVCSQASIDTIALWSFQVTVNNNVSASNLVRVYLCAADSAMNNGINVVVGNNNKSICLAQTVNGKNHVILAGPDKLLSVYPFTADVTIQRRINAAGDYIYSMDAFVADASGGVNSVAGQCLVEASRHPQQNFMGIYTKFSSSRANNTYYINSFTTFGHVESELIQRPEEPISRGDVVINELMVKPSSGLGIPAHNYIELHNTTDSVISVTDWTLSSGTRKGIIDPCLIPAHGYAVVCPSNAVSHFSYLPNVAGISSWPTLLVDGARVVLRNAEGRVVDFVDYSKSMYGADYKGNGGWSLERVDPYNTSNDHSNFMMSASSNGGTPCVPNSVLADNPDVSQPYLVSAMSDDSGLFINLTFSEPVDTTSVIDDIKINGAHVACSIVPSDDVALTHFKVSVANPIHRHAVYRVSGLSLSDLAGNPLSTDDEIRVAIPEAIKHGSILLNEIMSTAKPSSVDFVEVYNSSADTYNLCDLCFGMVKNGVLQSCTPFVEYSRLLFPGDYVVLCSDSLALVDFYSPEHPEWVVGNSKFNNLPSEGTFALSLVDGTILESLEYSSQMYSSMLADVSNVSLERILTSASCDNVSNWTSSAEHTHFATPTSLNSQNRDDMDAVASDVEMRVKAFTPDADGVDDEMVIATRFVDGFWMATLKVYSSSGDLVAQPYNNSVMPVTGELRWNGRDEHGSLQSPGTYIICLSAWQTGGIRKEFKKTCTIKVKSTNR